MSMTSEQAKKLGALISAARAKRGLSIRELADHLGVHHSWIGYLEQGRYLDPEPRRLVRLADILAIDLKQLDKIAKGTVSDGLLEPRVYFRAKYGMTAEEASEVEHYIRQMRRAS